MTESQNSSAVSSGPNRDNTTVDSFGSEWATFDQTVLSGEEREELFDRYFSIFPWSALPETAEGFDMGCGSGRWALLVAPRVHRLNCIDPAQDALQVAKRALADHSNVRFHLADTDTVGMQVASQDFGYSLGVLHHIPDTARALQSTTRFLKPGAPFLLYLYYRFDNRPVWFRLLWQASNLLRSVIAALPEGAKTRATDFLAFTVYWPLSRLASIVEMLGMNPAPIPLSFYRNSSIYTLRTDSRDRFGTPLEQRFTKTEIAAMMQDAGLTDVTFSNREPYWVAIAYKAPE